MKAQLFTIFVLVVTLLLLASGVPALVQGPQPSSFLTLERVEASAQQAQNVELIGQAGAGGGPNDRSDEDVDMDNSDGSGTPFAILATIPVGNGPNSVAVNPLTNRVYVTNYSDNTVSVIDGETNTVIATIPVGNAPRGIGVNTSTNKIYVANGNYGDPVSVIDGNTNTVISQVPVAINARGVAVNPVTNRIYVTTCTGGPGKSYVEVINGTTDTLIATILSKPPNYWPSGVAIDTNTNRIYVRDNKGLVVIDGDTNDIIDTIRVWVHTDASLGIGVNPITKRIYLLNNYWNGPLYVIDGLNNEILDTIQIPPIDSYHSYPWSVGVNPTTNHIFVTSSGGTVFVLDGSTNVFIGDPISVGGKLGGVGVNPVTNIIYVTDVESNAVLVIAEPPLLDLPVSYSTFARAALGNVGQNPGRVNSWFDHQVPYPWGQKDGYLLTWTGKRYPDPADERCIYGLNCYDNHNGIDFQKRMIDEPILAAASGVVTNIVHSTTGYGNRVWIDHLNGYATLYAHLKTDSISVTEGMNVNASQPIGVMGNTGTSTGDSGIHLHFGLYYDQNGDRQWTEDEVVDPYGWEPLAEPDQSDPWTVPSHYLWKYPLNSQTSADSSGTSITSQSGNATFTVPLGALDSTVTLELWDTPPVAGASAQLRSTGYSFWFRVLEWLSGGGDSGLVSTASSGFAQPVTVTITYSDTDFLHLDESQLTTYRWNESVATWVALSTTVDVDQDRVVAQTTDTGNFDLQAPLVCPADTQEPNDNYYAASLITPNGTPQNQLFDISQDEDWFKLAAVAGEKYAVQTINLAAGVDTIVQVYDVGGSTLLAADDDNGVGVASQLEWQASLDGTYFLRVAQAPGSAYGCDATYEFSVTQLQQPSLVTIAGPTTGVVQAGYTFTATVSPITATPPITYVWQAAGQSIITDTDGLSNTVTFTWTTPGPQAIAVTATNVVSTVTGTYGITISEPSVSAVSITKTVIPQGQVNYGDELIYTLVISAPTGMQLGIYDPLEDTTWVRFVEQPPGVTHVDAINGTLYLGGVITGAVTVTPSNQITVSFVTQVGIPGTVGWTVTVTNRACVYPFGGTLSGCVWSNEVTNPAFRPYDIYLPLVLRSYS